MKPKTNRLDFRAVCKKHGLDKSLTILTPHAKKGLLKAQKHIKAELIKKYNCDDYELTWKVYEGITHET